MNTIAILSLVALTVASLALIHESRLRRAVHSMLCRLFRSLNQLSMADRERDNR